MENSTSLSKYWKDCGCPLNYVSLSLKD